MYDRKVEEGFADAKFEGSMDDFSTNTEIIKNFELIESSKLEEQTTQMFVLCEISIGTRKLVYVQVLQLLILTRRKRV